MAEQKSYALFVLGCCMLLFVDFLWTFSSVLVSELLENYFDKPAIITFFSTSVFALYIPMFYSSSWLYSLFLKWRLNHLKNNALESFDSCSDHDSNNVSFNGNTTSPSNYHALPDADSNNRSPDELTSLIPHHNNNNNNELFNTMVKEVAPHNNNSNKSNKKRPIKDPFTHLHRFEIDALPGSDIYNNLQTQQILENERGWAVFIHNLKVALFLGPLWYTMNVTYNSALKMVSVATNSIISTTSSFFVLLIGVLVFCNGIRKLHLLCVVVAITGSFCVTYLGAEQPDDDVQRSVFEQIIGPSLSVLSAFLYGLYSVVVEYFTDKERPLHEQKDFVKKQRKAAEESDKEQRILAKMEATDLGVYESYLMASAGGNAGSDASFGNNSVDTTTTASAVLPGSLGAQSTASPMSSHGDQHFHEYDKFVIRIDGHGDEIVGIEKTTEVEYYHDLTTTACVDGAMSPTTTTTGGGTFNRSLSVNNERDHTVFTTDHNNNNNDENNNTFLENAEEELDLDFTDIDPSLIRYPPVNLDRADPKLVTGLMFGCIGVVNLFFAVPFLSLFHFTGFETLAIPTPKAIPMIVLNSFFGAAMSDMLFAVSITLTSPILASLAISLTIPIAFAYETIFLKKPLNLWAVLGSCLIVSSSSFVALDQYKTETYYDKLTGDYLTKKKEQRIMIEVEKRKKRQQLQFVE